MDQQAIPAVRRVSQLKGFKAGRAEAAALAQVGQGPGPLGQTQLGLEPAGGQGQHPVQPIPARKLLAQPLLLRSLQGFHRQLVFAGQFQHHLAEAGALQFHQKLDGVTAGSTGEAVIELLGR